MRYFITIDGGGTKTDSVLFDETGHVVLRDISMGCNALDAGIEVAKNRFTEIFTKMCEASPSGSIDAAFCGVAGSFPYAKSFKEEVLPKLNVKSFRMQTDFSMIISGMIGTGDGCAMVCGTGGSLGIRKNGEIVKHIGGRGYLIDAMGGGYSIAREGLHRCYRALDGRDEHTLLVDLFEKEIGKPLLDSVGDFYFGGRRYIASFAHLVFEGRELGDRACYEIIDKCSTKLAEYTWAAEKDFDGQFPVVMGGGIFVAYPYYADMVKAKASRKAKMIMSNVPPVYGGAVEAMADAGLACDESFKTTFLREYAEA